MSKVEDLKNKYSMVTAATFNKFNNADTTETKKYLEYFLKSWANRKNNSCPLTTDGLINLVNEFNQLLPYIPNKDIYGKDYGDISYLRLVIARAEEEKEEKTFKRDEHVFVLEENDEYILLQPLTHRGSLRYGAQTKWCTASKRDITVFNRYTKGGLLVYLIDKKGDKTNNYKKIAFHQSYSNDIITGDLNVFNSADNLISSEHLFGNNWNETTIMKIVTMYKFLFLREKKLKKSKDYVQSFADNVKKLDFETLMEHLQILEQPTKIDYTSTVQDQINNLEKNLNNITYARLSEA